MRMPHWPAPKVDQEIMMGLERIIAIMQSLGNPQNNLPPVIHVAGTNGKGSTLSFIKFILEEAGLTVHSYTSPHLISFNERIKLAGCDISDRYLYELLERTRIAAENNDIALTFFEGTTAAAFLAFAENPADVVILETGLGGRLDATNIVPHKIASVITPIAYDHMNFLGDTLSQIAFEKAGIIATEAKTILAAQEDEAFDILNKVAEIKSSPIFAYEYDYGLKKEDDGVYFVNDKHNIKLPELGLLGEHQYINAAAAIETVLQLDQFNVSEKNIIDGLAKTKWIGRIEKLGPGKVTEMMAGYEIFADGAHNEAGALALAAWLKEQKRKVILIVGITKKRNAAKFLTPFKEIASQIFGVRVAAEPSSYSGPYISKVAEEVGFESSGYDRIDEALEAIKLQNDPSALICVTGSLFLVGEILAENSYKSLK